MTVRQDRALVHLTDRRLTSPQLRKLLNLQGYVAVKKRLSRAANVKAPELCVHSQTLDSTAAGCGVMSPFALFCGSMQVYATPEGL